MRASAPKMQLRKLDTFAFRIYSTIISFGLIFGEQQSAGFQYRAIISDINERWLLNCIFPDSLPVVFVPLSENGENVTLLLHKNDQFHNEAPVYSVGNKNGLFILVPESGETGKNVAYYQDDRNAAFMSVHCSKKSNDILYNGIMYHKGVDVIVQAHTETYHTKTQSNSVPVDVYAHTDAGKSHTEELSRQGTPSIRTIRGITGSVTSYTVEVLVVADYSVFEKWLYRQDGESEDTKYINAKLEIQKYYAQFMNGVDLRYKNIGFTDFDIRIKPVGFVIADSPNIFPWTALQKQSSKFRNELNADKALKDFRTWLNDTKGLPEHDHAVLFTSYDLFTVKKNRTRKVKHTAGLAFIGTLCQYGDSVSVVEEQGGFQSVSTTAHEIGHSLGARHDGEDNPCKSEDRFIMAASGIGPVPPDKRLNPWHFSSCSVEYFRDFIASLLANGSTCLLDSPIKNSQRPHESMPGQFYSADEQCRLIWGPNSYLCRGAEFGNASSICTGMYCRDPSTANDCVLHTAARGTSCGSKQWCIEGKCTSSPHAPGFKDGCILGDQPGAAFNGMSCDQLLGQSPSYCYQSKVRAKCCSSCQKHFTWRKGCEYGDRVQGCQAWHCSHMSSTRDIHSDCCSTCGVGDIILPTMQPDWDTGTHTTPMPTDVCSDSENINNMDCATFINNNGKYVCYSLAVSRICCRTCREASAILSKGCEFGDRSPTLCAKISKVIALHCSQYGTQCCGTCINDTDSADKPSSHSILRILFFLYVLYEYFVK